MTLASVLDGTAAMLAELGSPYAVIGGVAIIARVRVRLTEDCDVVVRVTSPLDEVLRVAKGHKFTYAEDDASRSLFEAGLIHLKLASSADDAAGLDLIACDSPYLERVIERVADLPLLHGGGDADVDAAERLERVEAGRPTRGAGRRRRRRDRSTEARLRAHARRGEELRKSPLFAPEG